MSDSDRGLVFLINTYGQATNQSVNEYDILIDTNRRRPAPDFVVVGFDLGAVLTGSFNGQYASFTFDVSTGDIVDAFFADAPMNGSTIELPTLASEIGLSQKAGRSRQAFRYTVNAFSLVPGGHRRHDRERRCSIRSTRPSRAALNFAVVPADGGTASLPLSIDKSQQAEAAAARLARRVRR